MIRGRMDGRREARVPLELRGGDSQPYFIEAVIDTGFTGYLTLPPATIRELGLQPANRGDVILAGGVRQRWNIWIGQVLWHDKPRTIRILETPGTPLLGMQLLQDSQLTIQVRIGGDVLIEELQ